MNIAELKARIRVAAVNEADRGYLKRHIKKTLEHANADDVDQDTYSIAEFITRYVTTAPDVLEATLNAATNAGADHLVKPLFDAAKLYIEEQADFIPDDTGGVIGYVDDAYICYALMQGISDRHLTETGHTLLPYDYASANRKMLAMIGEPVAGQLKSAVENLLSASEVQDAVKQMGALIASERPSFVDPGGGKPPINNVPALQLGSIGKFQD